MGERTKYGIKVHQTCVVMKTCVATSHCRDSWSMSLSSLIGLPLGLSQLQDPDCFRRDLKTHLFNAGFS